MRAAPVAGATCNVCHCGAIARFRQIGFVLAAAAAPEADILSEMRRPDRKPVPAGGGARYDDRMNAIPGPAASSDAR